MNIINNTIRSMNMEIRKAKNEENGASNYVLVIFFSSRITTYFINRGLLTLFLNLFAILGFSFPSCYIEDDHSVYNHWIRVYKTTYRHGDRFREWLCEMDERFKWQLSYRKTGHHRSSFREACTREMDTCGKL